MIKSHLLYQLSYRTKFSSSRYECPGLLGAQM